MSSFTFVIYDLPAFYWMKLLLNETENTRFHPFYTHPGCSLSFEASRIFASFRFLSLCLCLVLLYVRVNPRNWIIDLVKQIIRFRWKPSSDKNNFRFLAFLPLVFLYLGRKFCIVFLFFLVIFLPILFYFYPKIFKHEITLILLISSRTPFNFFLLFF